MTDREIEFTACECVTKCVPLPHRCVCVGGCRGSNSCPSPCRWQPAEQHQPLLVPTLSVSLSLSPSGCVCCCCHCCSHRQRWLIKLEKPSSQSCPCSLVLSSLHLYSSFYCLGPPLSPSPLLSHLSLQPPLPLPLMPCSWAGALTPSRGPGAVGMR